MHDRHEAIGAFLHKAGWEAAHREPIAGDMSSRRYQRLSLYDQTAILMDADDDMSVFVRMTDWLASLNLSVPEIIAAEAETGLVLLEDLGNVSMKAAMRQDPSRKEVFFSNCLDILCRIRVAKVPALKQPTASDLVGWTRLADDHLPHVDTEGLEGFRQVLKALLTDALNTENTVALRDFHSENVMWLPTRTGFRSLGLLDYQDAFLTHPTYDLVSLLTDARNFVSRADRQDVCAQYIDRTGDDPEQFHRAFAAVSAQRNLRILGIFARAGVAGEYMHNTFGYFAEALEHPAFDMVREQTMSALPRDTCSS